MKRVLALLLAVMMIAVLFCGCESEAEKIAQIAGNWENVTYYTSDSVVNDLLAQDLYEEEIALLDTSAFGYVNTITFNADKTYTISCDVQKSYELGKEYYLDAFKIFYENREMLSEVYGMDLASLSEADFQAFYAELYGMESFDALIDLFAGDVEDYQYLTDDEENGTFRISSGRIYCKINGVGEEEYITYEITDGVLKLSFSDMVTYFTRG